MGTWREILKSKKGAVFNYRKFDELVDSAFIKQLRKKLDLSQRAFSAILGISPKTIESWEQEANPCKGTSSRLLYLLDRHPELVEELYGYENTETQKPVIEPVFSSLDYSQKDWDEIMLNRRCSESSSILDFNRKVDEYVPSNIPLINSGKGEISLHA